MICMKRTLIYKRPILSSGNKYSHFLYYRRPTSGLLESDSMRIVITAPDKDLLLQQDDVAFMLVQYEESEEESSTYTTTKNK